MSVYVKNHLKRCEQKRISYPEPEKRRGYPHSAHNLKLVFVGFMGPGYVGTTETGFGTTGKGFTFAAAAKMENLTLDPTSLMEKFR